jgi:PAS domain S-box-containing protein
MDAPSASASLTTDLHVEATYRLTEALVASENRLRRRLELLSEIVFETDRDDALIFLNNAWTHALGYPTSECLGRRLRDFVVPGDLSLCAEVMTNGVPSGGRVPLRLRRANSEIAWVEISAVPLSDGGVVGALHDITAQKHTQDELAKLSLVASYTDNLVIITDREGRTEWVNQAFVSRTGFTLEDMVGRKPGDLLQGPDTNATTVAQIAEWLAEGRSFRTELLNYTKAREAYWVEFQISPIRGANGEVERFVSIQTDSTELHRTREELEAAKERAESASEAKTQFLATMSHEMRTPLNVILGSTDLVLDGDIPARDVPFHLRQVNANAEVLLRLISDMLDVSKIEAGQVAFERKPVVIRACLGDAVAPAADRARTKGLQFTLDVADGVPDQMMGDADRLRQIISNLAENAVKFTDHGSVTIHATRVGPQAGSGPALQLRVIDTGIGISTEAQTRIFKRFEQADSSTTRRKGGAGLGLSIVRSLVEALGGTVTVRSRTGDGAEFTVTLPLEAITELAPRTAERPTSVGGPSAAAPVTNVRILVAEDTDANFSVLDVYLKRAGYLVSRATNGREAVEMAPQADLILMDVEMPEMDGLAATRVIRDDERESGRTVLPILALTAHAVDGYRERCLAAGCSGYLAKPIRKQPLLDAVAAALSDH